MRLWPYLHPITAGTLTVVLFYVGSLGLRARNDRRRAALLLRQHQRLATPVYWLVLLSWLGGVLSTWAFRHDLELFASTHLRIGLALVVAMTGGAITAKRMHHATARNMHPWFGIAAVLLAAAQVFFGLQITP